jgi:hypothetical protein
LQFYVLGDKEVRSDWLSGCLQQLANFILKPDTSDNLKQMPLELAVAGSEKETGECYEVKWILSQKVSVYSVNVVFNNESS